MEKKAAKTVKPMKAVKRAKSQADWTVYWPSLLKYLVDRDDVAYIRSITIMDKVAHHHDDPCIHEAKVIYRKKGRSPLNVTIYPGHLWECTWID